MPKIRILPAQCEWKEDNKELVDTWSKSDSVKQEIIDFINLEIKPQVGGFTELHEMLAYTAIQFKQVKGEKWLIVYSDLIQESKGVDKNRFPPEMVFDFDEVNVRFLFVPFLDYENWNDLSDVWDDYFNEAGVETFEMYSVASSEIVDVLLDNELPRMLPVFNPSW